MRLRSLKQDQELRALERETRRLREPEDGSVDRVTVLWGAKWWILTIALVAGIAAYGVSRFAVSPTYSSSVDVVITAHSVSGGLSAAITASNDLANQYAQLANSPPVLALASQRLPGGGHGLGAATSAGTVGDQNLVRVTTLADSPDLARIRANAVASAFVVHITAVNARDAADLRAAVERELRSNKRTIFSVKLAVAVATRKAFASSPSRSAVANSVLAAKQALLATLVTQRQSIISDLAQSSVEAQPSVRMAAPAGRGAQIQPKPVLYAGVAAMASALAAGQILILVRLRRRD